MSNPTTDLATRPAGPAADSRDMVAVHDMFRRQLARLPDLLATVPLDDVGRRAPIPDEVIVPMTEAGPAAYHAYRARLEAAAG